MFVDAGKMEAAKVVNVVCSLATLAVVGRTLGARSFGVYGLVVAITVASRQLFDSRSSDLVLRYVPIFRRERGALGTMAVLRLALFLDAIATVAGVAVLIALRSVLASRVLHDGSDSSLVVLGAVLLLAGLGSSVARSVAILHRRFTALAGIDALTSLAALGLTVAVSISHPSVWRLLAAHTASTGATTVLLWWLATRLLRADGPPSVVRSIVGRPRRGDFSPHGRAVFRYVVGINLFASLRLVQSTLPALLLGALFSPVQAGYYLVGQRIAGYAATAAAPIQTVLQPRLTPPQTADEQVEWRRSLAVGTGLFGLVACPFVVVFGAFAGIATTAILGSEFSEASVPVALVTIGVSVGLLATPSGMGLLLGGRVGYLNVWFALATAAQLLTIWISIDRWQASGAAVGYLVFYVVFAAAQFGGVRQLTRTGATDAAPPPSAVVART
jgi:O-antigen/teichoic acid export membrane protein